MLIIQISNWKKQNNFYIPPKNTVIYKERLKIKMLLFCFANWSS